MAHVQTRCSPRMEVGSGHNLTKTPSVIDVCCERENQFSPVKYVYPLGIAINRAPNQSPWIGVTGKEKKNMLCVFPVLFVLDGCYLVSLFLLNCLCCCFCCSVFEREIEKERRMNMEFSEEQGTALKGWFGGKRK